MQPSHQYHSKACKNSQATPASQPADTGKPHANQQPQYAQKTRQQTDQRYQQTHSQHHYHPDPTSKL